MPTPGSTKVRALDEEPNFFRCCLRARLEGEGEGDGEGEALGEALDPASDQLKDPLHGSSLPAQHVFSSASSLLCATLCLPSQQRSGAAPSRPSTS